MGTRAAADNARKWADLPCFLLPFPSLLAVRTTVTCKRGKKHNAKLPILSFFQIYSLLSSLSGFLFFPSSGGRSAGFFSPSSVGSSGGAAVSQLQLNAGRREESEGAALL